MALFAVINLNPLITKGQSVVIKLVSQTKEKYVSWQKYLFMTLWNHNTHSHTNRRHHFYSLCLVPTKAWPFLIFTSVHLHHPLCRPSPIHELISHCVLLWQDNSISLIQYALCLYLHAPVTVPLVEEGVVYLSSSEFSSPPFVFELISNSILIRITQSCIFVINIHWRIIEEPIVSNTEFNILWDEEKVFFIWYIFSIKCCLFLSVLFRGLNCLFRHAG